MDTEESNLFPVPTCSSMLKFYVPVAGVLSYSALSIYIMNPNLRIFGQRDISNLLLINAVTGTGSYIFTRKHLEGTTVYNRITFSMTGSLLFTFGSVLIWSVLSSVLPVNNTAFAFAGVSTSLIFLNIGRAYLKYVDKLIQ